MFDRILKAMMASDDARAEIESLRIANATLREERDRAERRYDELWDFVARMEKQRDDWRARFMEQWRQHQNAQALLEAHIYSVGTALTRAMALLNQERTEHGKDALTMAGMKRLAEEGEKALSTSAEYGDAMRKLEATKPRRGAFGEIREWSDVAADHDLQREDFRR